MIPRTKLAELRELSKAATPGPWYVDTTSAKTQHVHSDHDSGGGGSKTCICTTVDKGILAATDKPIPVTADSAFIAAANPSIITQLLDAIETLSGALEKMRDHKDGWRADSVQRHINESYRHEAREALRAVFGADA